MIKVVQWIDNKKQLADSLMKQNENKQVIIEKVQVVKKRKRKGSEYQYTCCVIM